MSIIRIVSIFPSPDKVGEMRSLLEGRIRSTPGTSLSIGVIGEMATFVETTVFESLEAYEKVRDADMADSSILQHRAQIGSLVRQPVVIRLLDTIISPLEPIGSNMRYNQRVVFFPTPQGENSLREALEEFVRGQQAAGRVHIRLAQPIFSHDGSAYTVGDSYETMAELENVLRGRASAVSDFSEKIATSIRQPRVNRLLEVIVPANG